MTRRGRLKRPRAAEEQRFHTYLVNQMYSSHSEVPTFLINVHRVDNVDDARAYVGRLSGIAPLFDQLIVNLEERAEKGIITPKFVFPLVLEAAQKVVAGPPFAEGGFTALG